GASNSLSSGDVTPDTSTMAVGTKLCYATYAQHPKNTDNGDVTGGDSRWSYSVIKCAVVVKSPKVQFLNSDVTVGRQNSGSADCAANLVADAPIITSGSPTNKSPSNLYGSWVEYGAFAPGVITDFGSAATPFGISSQARKLTFGNNNFSTSGNLGGFAYGKNCLADWFGLVKDDNTNLTSLPAAYDQDTNVLDLQQIGSGTDRTGYVANNRNIQIGEPVVGGPAAADTTPSPTTQTTVRVNARAENGMGTNGCPKLLVKVTDSDGKVDQDTKEICSTGFQDYDYVFYQNTNGPIHIETRFVNDAVVAGVDRNIVLASITTNGQSTYVYNRASNPGLDIAGDGDTDCVGSGGIYFRIQNSSTTAGHCYGLDIDPVTAPLSPAQQQADYKPPAETTVTVTAKATTATTADSTNQAPGGCPFMYVKVTGTNGVVREHTQIVCSTSSSAYSFTVNLGGGGVNSVEASYDPMDYFGGGNDRNLYISNITVDDTSVAINANSGTDVELKNGSGDFEPIASAPATCKDNSSVIFLSATNNVADGWCATVRVNNVTEPIVIPPPKPPLTSDYTGFNHRSIVIYAKKTTAGPCSDSSNGNITINRDLIYKRDSYASILDIPRITIMADCNIKIASNVVEVNANLIAGDAIKTCTEVADTQDKCNQPLTVRGTIGANRLLLWRTHGADQTKANAEIPGETFDMSPSQMVSGYNRGLRSSKPSTVYEVDLPPRY
ncbi:MAG: carbohydrate-binding domain-containing protein, partial [Candidatus Saccharibacteria bacterium]|nr:carbohydrate-binding domain-containing protein [Candidatus Saccharibacteria bacterium]